MRACAWAGINARTGGIMFSVFTNAATSGLTNLSGSSVAVLVGLIGLYVLIGGGLVIWRLTKLPKIQERNRINRYKQRMAEAKKQKMNFMQNAVSSVNIIDANSVIRIGKLNQIQDLLLVTVFITNDC